MSTHVRCSNTDAGPAGSPVDRFEAAALVQRPVAAEHYDEEYFASEWRAGDNRYDLESRRRIEANNPALIKEVFAPSSVLDVGCGPGFLMHFLAELGVEVHGIDFSPSSLELPPALVRDRITIGDVTQPLVPPRAHDLVVCREVLEHLTVVQVHKTVAQVCRSSARFAYVTTRFLPDPADLL